ncbi:MAG: hypothetical protein MUF58_11790 [Arcicella sp.]|nr:hypothetical protein [Arcicella sp.]
MKTTIKMYQIILNLLSKEFLGRKVKTLLIEIVVSLLITIAGTFIVKKIFTKEEQISKQEVQRLLRNQEKRFENLEIETDSLKLIIEKSKQNEIEISKKLSKIDSLQRLSTSNKFDYLLKRARASK